METPEKGYKWLEQQKILNIAGNGLNCQKNDRKLMEIATINGWKQQKKAGNCWKMQKMIEAAGNGWKWLEMAEID